MLEILLEVAVKVFYILYIICELLIFIFLFLYIYTNMIKYMGLTCLCFVLLVLFGKFESITMKKLLDKI